MQKLLLLRHHGVHKPVIIQFDRALCELEPEAFVADVLCRVFAPSQVVVGYDFNFGKDRRGTPQLLVEELERCGIGALVQDAVTEAEGVISSTRIRTAGSSVGRTAISSSQSVTPAVAAGFVSREGFNIARRASPALFSLFGNSDANRSIQVLLSSVAREVGSGPSVSHKSRGSGGLIFQSNSPLCPFKGALRQ